MDDQKTVTSVKRDSEILAEVYRNAQLALTSISDIMPYLREGELKNEILKEHEEYERVCSEVADLAKRRGLELKEPGKVKKAMMWMGISMNAGSDDSDSHIAEMMIKGTVTGITCLRTSLSDAENGMAEEIEELLRGLISLEEQFEQNLKRYL